MSPAKQMLIVVMVMLCAAIFYSVGRLEQANKDFAEVDGWQKEHVSCQSTREVLELTFTNLTKCVSLLSVCGRNQYPQVQ